jgi:hypothetical protein
MDESLLIEHLKNKFVVQFEKYELEYLPENIVQGKIHSFFVQFTSANELEKRWREMSNFIALHFQSVLENKFEIWNIYLFFKMPVRIENALKYMIENDTFSSRKILIECNFANQEIINEHILNTDLSLGEKHRSDNNFEKNSTIWEALKDKPIKKIISAADETAFENIFNAVKQSKNEN